MYLFFQQCIAPDKWSNQKVHVFSVKFFLVKKHTIIDLLVITAHAPLSAQSSNLVVFRLQLMYLYLLRFKKSYVVGIHLNCLDKSRQFKRVPTPYDFIKEIKKHIAQASFNKTGMQTSAELFFKCLYYIFFFNDFEKPKCTVW